MKTCRDMLDELDQFLCRNDAESGKLWDVLAALHTTTHIRREAFPRLAKKLRGGSFIAHSFVVDLHVAQPLSKALTADTRSGEGER